METNNQNVIIADTSGLVSLFSPADQNHEVAVKAAERLRSEHKDILIPAAVFVEFLNILGRKAGLNHLLTTVQTLAKRGLGFKVQSGQGANIDTTTASGKLIFVFSRPWPNSSRS